MTVQTPLDPTPPPAAAPTPPRRTGAALAVSIVTIVVGGCAILGAFASSGFSAAAAFSRSAGSGQTQASDIQGVRDLDVDIVGGSLTIEYGEVSEAVLDGPRADVASWTFEKRGSTLRVVSPDHSLVDWGSSPAATLTLPRELGRSGIDLRVDLAGGSLQVDGDFGDLTVQLTGGEATLSGRAEALDLSVAGGSASAEVSGTDSAAFEVAGGDLSAVLTGTTPTSTRIEITAGSADIALPDDTYLVVSDGPGSLDNSLPTSPTATARVEVQTALGSVTLRAS